MIASDRSIGLEAARLIITLAAMAHPPVTELSERARSIFRLVVEEYIASGRPVGSKRLAGARGIELSPASVRSVLADLEARGLLAAPHTSAGRLPTDGGLRLFVDAMMQVAEPSPEERSVIEQRLAEPGPIEFALEAASALLSDLSGAAGMVLVPQRENRLKHFSLVPLDGDKLLAVMVSEDGHVENRVMAWPGRAMPSALEQASNYISANMAGRTLEEAAQLMGREIAAGKTALDEASRSLVESGLAVWAEDSEKRQILIVRGQAKLLDDEAMQDVDRVRRLLEDLEEKEAVADLLNTTREAEAARIFIGSENRLFSLTGSSLIASPCRDADGKVVGVLGVIGPTRLNYARVIPMVDFTAHSLGKLFG